MSEGPKRLIDIELFLNGGHSHQITLQEDSLELRELFRTMASGEASFLQLPLKGGRAALTFRSTDLVSLITQPPVLVQPESRGQDQASVASGEERVETTPFAVVEDFLSPSEEQAVLDFALANLERFAPGTTGGKRSTYRENMVLMDFGKSPRSKMLQNRLLTWFPVLAKSLGMSIFPVTAMESQFTANNDGHYYRLHDDVGEQARVPRALTCVYYLHRRPKGFSGGELRLYDTVVRGESRRASRSFRDIESRSNRLVVFPSGAGHEVRPVLCPSGEFADSRFSVTNWIHRGENPDPEATFGWGQMRCGAVPPAFEGA